MKKSVFAIILTVLCLALCVVGCEENQETEYFTAKFFVEDTLVGSMRFTEGEKIFAPEVDAPEGQYVEWRLDDNVFDFSVAPNKSVELRAAFT